MNQEEIENLKRQITSNEIKSVIKKLPANKSPGPGSFTGEFYQTLRVNTDSSHTTQKKKKKIEGKAFTFTLQGPHYPNTKIK